MFSSLTRVFIKQSSYILGVVKRNPLLLHEINGKILDFFLLHLIYIYIYIY